MARPSKNAPTEKSATTTTPLMAQYAAVKAKYPDAILLFRVGDFYETFGEDAIRTAQALGITLTSRNNGGSDVELAGFPHHAMDTYLPRLVRAGYRVAICEQMEKPVPGKVVRRSVTEIVTPGVAFSDALLENRQNNYLAALALGKDGCYGLAFLDISTGEFFACEGDVAVVDKLLQSFKPAEVVLPKGYLKEFTAAFGDKFYTYPLEDWIFTPSFGREKLLQHFQSANLKGFGIEELPHAQAAAGATLHYLTSIESNRLAHIRQISRLKTDEYVWLDRFTIRNLELVQPNHPCGASLLQVLDHTVSPMGARLLKKWVLLPLTDIRKIRERHDAVAVLLEHRSLARQLEGFIRQVGDLERLTAKASVGKINPREVLQLRRALLAVEAVKHLLCPSGAVAEDEEMASAAVALGGAVGAGLRRMGEALNPCLALRERIGTVLHPEAPPDVRKGGAIADGAHPQLDEWRHLVRHSRELLIDIQQREAERTGIPNLKIGFNSVFGYYLEVTSKWADKAPAHWIRKQTTANGERYITSELKELEGKILTAEERILELEEQIFRELVGEIADYIGTIQQNAHILARLDCFLSFATLSEKYGYVRPEINDTLAVDIRQGRHPVIETQLPLGEAYVPNDLFIDNDTAQILLITGPNMAGKSALLRQTALIVLLAQMGCFVPARQASIGIVDKVFTRVGASDNISSGESTFMVEMTETALILNNISERSLILLDEIGRGTSTYDGISIAWSIAEYLHDNPKARPKTLFATHYHELSELAERHERIHNFHISTREVGQKVIFLRKLEPGSSNHSFGIHVARMAGIPAEIVQRAREILSTLEADGSRLSQEKDHPSMPTPEQVRRRVKQLQPPLQLQIFDADEYTRRIREELLALDINTMTPIDALWKLSELRRLAEKH